ncbi:MAG: hypothetical protein B7Z15_09070 [Rhizobiales bacterium 32-66-8]|nr:MAG: hypothetical protein B7Z15_09070 [Rhizobiales bacterium 32-66-8]
MRIVTNYDRLPPRWTATGADGTPLAGTTVPARTVREFRAQGQHADAVFLVNCDPDLLIRLVLARPFGGLDRPLVASDLVLRRPRGLKGHLLHAVKRPLLARADLYLNFFSDTRGLEEAYGIDPARCRYVPFKVNLAPADAEGPMAEDYVLCFGRSLRDFDTFFAAMERLPFPGAIARVDPAELARHGARLTRPLSSLPPNIAQLPDDGSAAAALNAMFLGKCVIGSQGPGMSDIFTHEVLTVPPQDPAALAAQIAAAWTDTDLRARTAAAGQRFARAAGFEADLVQRILDAVARSYGRA